MTKYALKQSERIDGMSVIQERDSLIKEWLQEAAKDIKEALNHDLRVETKTRKNDLVTYMDRKIEEDFVQKIRKHFPEDKIVSEEGFGDNIETINMEKDTVWFLDPIDGTLNFVLQNENFAIMLAVYKGDVGQQAYIYDVMQDKLYWSIKGQGVYCDDERLPRIKDKPLANGLFGSNSMYISDKQIQFNAEITKRAMGVRTIGSAALEAVELIKGSIVAYLSYGLKSWDLAAGMMMVQENGGVVARLDGSPMNLFEPAPIIMATPTVKKEIKSLL